MATSADGCSELLLKSTDSVLATTPRDHLVAGCEPMPRHYLGRENQGGMVFMPIGAGKTVAAARWVLARCGRTDVRCA